MGKNPLAMNSLIFGVMAVLIWLFGGLYKAAPYGILLLAILAILCGGLGAKKAKANSEDVITPLIGLVIGIVGIIGGIVLLV